MHKGLFNSPVLFLQADGSFKAGKNVANQGEKNVYFIYAFKSQQLNLIILINNAPE